MATRYKQYSKIEVYPVVYDKDTNSQYILDSNGDKVIIKNWEDVTLDDNYEIVVDITTYAP
jgi:uncharacterized protein YqkB